MPEEMVEWGMPLGPRYVSFKQVADEAKSIRLAAKHVEAMRVREVLDAVGRMKSLKAVGADIMERQAAVDIDSGQLVRQIRFGEIETRG